MAIDVSQFHETYLEEATEHLASLETGLLGFEKDGEGDIDAIFRAAHSIKGGAGTFGFDAIANFTHDVEEVLDQARENNLEMSTELVNVLLKAVDIITEMVTCAKNKEELPPNFGADVAKEVAAFLNKPEPAEEVTQKADAQPSTGRAVRIDFKPQPHLLCTGSDPLNIFRELSSLGAVEVRVIRDGLPEEIDKYNPESLYYSWEISLKTDVTLDEIKDVFMFVEDDADITYTEENTVESALAETSVTVQPSTNDTAPAKEEANGEVKEGKAPKESAAEKAVPPNRRKPDQIQSDASSFMRVATDKVDELINLAGEMVTTGAMVQQHVKDVDQDSHEGLYKAVSELEHYTRNMQQAVMAIRMMPVSFVFNRFPRMVRDTAALLEKKVELITEGEHTELDKTVIEKIADPLTHLVRNAIDHGIEPAAERAASGKEDVAKITLAASYKGGNVVIEVSDDGKGLNREAILDKAINKGLVSSGEDLSDEDVWQLIFEPGFSTAQTVTDVSGRGVGMDVVRRNIQALGGNVRIVSVAGKGSTFTISLPLTLAILDGMAIEAQGAVYIIPILGIIESTRPDNSVIKTLKNDIRVMDFRGQYLPFICLSRVFGFESNPTLEEGIAVIVEADNQQFALFVDDLLGERQVVIKSLEKNYKMVEGVSGATILGDGTVSFILDLSGILRRATREGLFRREIEQELQHIEDMVKNQQTQQEVPHATTH